MIHPINRYGRTAKIEIRDILIETAHKHIGTGVEKIFTLPSAMGYCAIEFRKKWKNCHIVGVDNNENFVRGMDSSIVDEMYHGDGLNLGKGPYYKSKARRTRSQVHQFIDKSQKYTISEVFDLLYIDLTLPIRKALWEEPREKLGNIFLNHTNEKAVVGLTFMQDGVTPEEQDQLLNSLLPKDWELDYYNYVNGKCEMIMAVYQK